MRSPTPSCSSSSRSRSVTPLNKRKRHDSNFNDISDIKNNFWENASNVMKSLKNEETEDGLKHWILYLENELRNIKNPKTLKALQRKIIEIVDKNTE